MDLRDTAGDEGSGHLRRPELARTSTAPLLALAAIPIICCGLPLLIGALVALGGAGWLIAHQSLLALPLVGFTAMFLGWRWRRRRADSYRETCPCDGHHNHRQVKRPLIGSSHGND